MEKVKNREWVKTATIIFLAILLVLTFFSNTIMNRTLPEVASQEVESASITAKVRGTGKVSAVSNTEVKAKATRYLGQINVKEGQEVEAGDVLFTMGAGDSDELETAKDNLDSLKYSLQRAYVSATPTYNSAAEVNISNLYQAMNSAFEKLQQIGTKTGYTQEQINDAKVEADKKEADLNSAKAYWSAQETVALDEYYAAFTEEKKAEKLKVYDNLLAEADAEIIPLQTAYDEAYAEYQTRAANTIDAVNTEYSTALTAYTAAEYAYYSAVDAYNNSNASASNSAAQAYINAAEYQSKIEKAEAKVAELSGEDPQEVVAPVSGTVTSISVNSGSKVSKDQVMCIIESDDKGYTMSFSITNDQAKRIKVGDSATISNYYWGSDITATVSSIQVDQTDPQSKKKVTVTLEGDVTSGAELTVSIGQKSSTYDTVVPNSAVRSDSNGSFVLVLQAKNSPLGNRYYAKRVSVEVLASDDVNSAISGDLSSGDFVITTSSAPISSGDQVRMADTAQ